MRPFWNIKRPKRKEIQKQFQMRTKISLKRIFARNWITLNGTKPNSPINFFMAKTNQSKIQRKNISWPGILTTNLSIMDKAYNSLNVYPKLY
jgi:hypothetical protein